MLLGSAELAKITQYWNRKSLEVNSCRQRGTDRQIFEHERGVNFVGTATLHSAKDKFKGMHSCMERTCTFFDRKQRQMDDTRCIICGLPSASNWISPSNQRHSVMEAFVPWAKFSTSKELCEVVRDVGLAGAVSDDFYLFTPLSENYNRWNH